MSSAFSKKQRDFLSGGLADINLLWGASGSGKTFVANLMAYGLLCKKKNPGLALFSGYTTESLYDNVVHKLLEMDRGVDNCHWHGSPQGQRLTFKNGVEVACVGASTENAHARIQGKSVVFWYADEVTKQPKNFVEMALGRCRKAGKLGMTVTPAIWTFNADHPGHYIKTEYLDKARPEYRERRFDMADNPTMNAEFLEKQKARYSGVYYARMVENKWTVAEGVVYDEFRRERHVLERDASQFKRWIMGIDWGYEHPLALLLIGVDGDGAYHVAAEICVRHQLVDASLMALIRPWLERQVDYAYCDSARPEYLVQFADLSRVQTIEADKAVHEGIGEVQKALKPNGAGRVRLTIDPKCISTIREFETYQWLGGRNGTKDEPAKINDDCLDALRYAIFTDMAYNNHAVDFKSLPRIEVGR